MFSCDYFFMNIFIRSAVIWFVDFCVLFTPVNCYRVKNFCFCADFICSWCCFFVVFAIYKDETWLFFVIKCCNVLIFFYTVCFCPIIISCCCFCCCCGFCSLICINFLCFIRYFNCFFNCCYNFISFNTVLYNIVVSDLWGFSVNNFFFYNIFCYLDVRTYKFFVICYFILCRNFIS